MASDLEKSLARAKYVALPLPHTKTGPTTILTFSDGFLHVVRNERSCVPDPPVAVTEDPSVDVLAFQRKFSFSAKGLLGFFFKAFGHANVDLEAKQIRSATVELGGLSHVTIESGAFVDYLLTLVPTTPCYRDLSDERNLTIVAALRPARSPIPSRTRPGLPSNSCCRRRRRCSRQMPPSTSRSIRVERSA
jgi:hypothetical protein